MRRASYGESRSYACNQGGLLVLRRSYHLPGAHSEAPHSFGTNDPSDPPEISFDKKTDCYYVRYHPPGSHESWHDGGSALSLREAVFLAHSKLGPVVHWTDY